MRPYTKAAEMMPEGNRIEGWRPVDMIPLSRAVLCANCDWITPATNGHCLRCGSRAVINLEKLINHQLEAAKESSPHCPPAVSDATGEA